MTATREIDDIGQWIKKLVLKALSRFINITAFSILEESPVFNKNKAFAIFFVGF